MIYSYIKAALRRLFRPSVDDCLSSINKTILSLAEAAKRNTEIATVERSYAAQLLGRAYAHDDEANRAQRIEAKLLNLTS